MIFKEFFDKHLSGLGKMPDWWRQAKCEAWSKFESLPMPGRQDESWRFSSVGGLALDAYELRDASETRFGFLSRGGTFPDSVSDVPVLPNALVDRGVIFCSLKEALLKHGDLVKTYFQKYPVNLGSEKFSALNAAFADSGALLYIPKGVEVKEPFLLRHRLSGAAHAAFPHTLVILEDNAEATLLEIFEGGVEGASSQHLVSGVNDLHAASGARLNYIGMQNWSLDTLAFQSNSIVAEKDAKVTSLNVNLGGRQARHESHSRLLGPGAASEMLALTIARGSQEFDQRTLQTHAAPEAYSNLLYKNALMDCSKTIFSGLIVVEPGAQKTDAYQSNRNLLLSPDAEADSLPGLEIEANDVRCTHGSTTSRIPPEQQFYLQARGIDLERANELLIFGFFGEVLDKVTDPAVRKFLELCVRRKMV